MRELIRLYRIVRTFDGETKTLKAPNSHLDKSFTEFVEAERLMKKLNNYSKPGYYWSVEEVS